jgi:hypothetical protein
LVKRSTSVSLGPSTQRRFRAACGASRGVWLVAVVVLAVIVGMVMSH